MQMDKTIYFKAKDDRSDYIYEIQSHAIYETFLKQLFRNGVKERNEKNAY